MTACRAGSDAGWWFEAAVGLAAKERKRRKDRPGHRGTKTVTRPA